MHAQSWLLDGLFTYAYLVSERAVVYCLLMERTITKGFYTCISLLIVIVNDSWRQVPPNIAYL